MTKTSPINPDLSADKNRFSPSAFMRARRPDEFSDTIRDEVPFLEKSFFEYHLDSITSRSDEQPFQHFCRKLAQKEICPNLLPQTGPTGGGDGKVDTETYPVADRIAEVWYEGNVRAASERWAFAISAKRDWKPKVRSDVKKICETNRGYTTIYFMSNQFIRDRERAEVEDDFTKKYGIPVRILDRSWIVDKVFERGHEQLAIDALNIAVSTTKKQVQKGPLDTERQGQLDELEAEIADPTRYAGIEYELAEDCLSAAIIARELELGRVEVDGRFDRAERIADKVNNGQQRLRIKYHRAWTACYWFDDFDTVEKSYSEIEHLALASDQSEDLERLSNIWSLIISGVRYGFLNADVVGQRTERLKYRLIELGNHRQRPNNAAYARTLLCTVELSEGLGNDGVMDRVLKDFASIFVEVEHMGGYPFDKYASLFEEIGDILGERPEYDKAFEVLLPILERRRSEGAAGLAILKRGIQKLDKGAYYEAIKVLGRAQQKLIKYEFRDDLVYCLIACAHAYARVGLHWAAHSNLLAAASQAFSEFKGGGHITRPALRSIQQLIWTELQLGRIPQVLTYLHFSEVVAAHLQLDDKGKDAYREQRQDQDGVLAMLLLRSSLPQLAAMERLPATLEALGLYASAMALFFLLGHGSVLAEQGYVPTGTSQAELFETFQALSDQPAKDDLPTSLEIFDADVAELRSSTLGCQWHVKVETNELAIRIGEAFLGFVEAFFATSLGTDAIPHRQHINILIAAQKPEQSSSNVRPLRVVVDDPTYLIRIEFGPSYDPNRELETHTLHNFLRDTLAVLIPRILYVPDLSLYFDRIASREEGFGRSLVFSDVFTSASNIVGRKPTYQLQGWLDARSYPLKRSEPVRFKTLIREEEDVQPTFGIGEPPEELRSTDKLKHGQRRVLSIIEAELWNAAEWKGMAIAIYPRGPPVLALVFVNEEPARRIFANWRSQFGEKDEDDVIRIALITGIDRHNASSYVTIISTNAENAFKDRKPFDQAVIVSRIKRMDRSDPKNLQMLRTTYGACGYFMLVPGVMGAESKQPLLLTEIGILKRELTIRPAWQIGDNDPDFPALLPEDDPLIPEGVKDPPVLRALQRRRKMRG